VSRRPKRKNTRRSTNWFHLGHRPCAATIVDELLQRAEAILRTVPPASRQLAKRIGAELRPQLHPASRREEVDFGAQHTARLALPVAQRQALHNVQRALGLITFDEPRDHLAELRRLMQETRGEPRAESRANRTDLAHWRSGTLKPTIKALSRAVSTLRAANPWPPAAAIARVMADVHVLDDVLRRLRELDVGLAGEDHPSIDDRLCVLLLASLTPKQIAAYLDELGYSIDENNVNTRASRLRRSGRLKDQPTSPRARYKQRPKTGALP
jgi:hypothetical protein